MRRPAPGAGGFPGALRISSAGRPRVHAVLSFDAPFPAAAAAGDGYARLARELRRRRLAIVHERIFGSIACEREVLAARREALAGEGVRADTPATYVEGRPTWGEGLAGAIVAAVDVSDAADSPWDVRDDSVPCGRAWRRNGAAFVVLQGLQGVGPGEEPPPRAVQARAAIEKAHRLLRSQGADLRHVVRTWYYLDRILEWYAEFNRARTAAYGDLGLAAAGAEAARLPASTGIGARAPGGAACTLDLLAVVPGEGGGVRTEMLASPAQPEPVRYGSGFSRGALVRTPGGALVEVSGTAAIDGSGAGVHRGDAPGQVAHTLDVVERLLGRVGGGLADIAAATVFFKRPQDAEAFAGALAVRGLRDLPAVRVVADVCREELLFEIDAEAIVTPRPATEGAAPEKEDVHEAS